MDQFINTHTHTTSTHQYEIDYLTSSVTIKGIEFTFINLPQICPGKDNLVNFTKHLKKK